MHRLLAFIADLNEAHGRTHRVCWVGHRIPWGPGVSEPEYKFLCKKKRKKLTTWCTRPSTRRLPAVRLLCGHANSRIRRSAQLLRSTWLETPPVPRIDSRAPPATIPLDRRNSQAAESNPRGHADAITERRHAPTAHAATTVADSPDSEARPRRSPTPEGLQRYRLGRLPLGEILRRTAAGRFKINLLFFFLLVYLNSFNYLCMSHFFPFVSSFIRITVSDQ